MKKTNQFGILGAATAAALGVTLLTGCAELDEKRRPVCQPVQAAPVILFLGTDGHYHYGSPKGKIVPADKVPESARKVPGYKAPAAPKVDLKKPDAKPGDSKNEPPKVVTPPKVPAPAPAPVVKVPAKVGR